MAGEAKRDPRLKLTPVGSVLGGTVNRYALPENSDADDVALSGFTAEGAPSSSVEVSPAVAEVPAPFVWDKDYGNNEQVRPYYAGYLAEHELIEARGEYPYNDAFKGKIPGLEGPNEDTGIYMLQTMHDLDEMKANVADFKAAGGVNDETLEPGREYRGTVAAHGWYSGGTGWKTYESARAVYYPGHGLLVTQKGKKQGYFLRGASTMIIVDKPKSKKAAGA